MKRLITVFVLFVVIVGAYYGLQKYTNQYVPEAVPVETDVTVLQKPGEIPNSELQITNSSPSSSLSSQLPAPSSQLPTLSPIPHSQFLIPNSLSLRMPFYSQAPFGNWDFPWQEACEEASVLLVANVYQNKNWSREDFNQEILRLVDWQKVHFGDYLDTTVEQTTEMLEDYLDLHAKIHENPTFEDIQAVLAKGHFIIMPFAGKQLGNPFYSNGGPNYHMLVVKGYKEGNKIITHDVGTKNGENYVYSWATIERAMHDFADPIQSGAKRMIEVLP